MFFVSIVHLETFLDIMQMSNNPFLHMPEISQDEVWEIIDMLPDDLREALFSGDTADAIGEACKRADIDNEDKTSEVARYTGHVLMGILAPADLPAVLQEEIGLEEEKAQRAYEYIERHVFEPVKNSLEAINKEIERTEREEEIAPPSTKETARRPPEKKENERQRENADEDPYREPIE